MMTNATSQDFPLRSKFGNLIPSHIKENRTGLKIFADKKNGYNNECPDFLKIDCLKEVKLSYRNPFLDDVKNEDRSIYLKNTNKIKEQIEIIDKLKTKKEYSQNPNYLKLISSSNDINILRKRDSLNNFDSSGFENNNAYTSNSQHKIFYSLKKSYDPESYRKKIKTLDGQYSPKIYFGIKNSLQLDKKDFIDNVDTPLNLKIDPRKSSYLRNMNSFKIGDSLNENKEKFFNFEKKIVQIFDPISDRIVTVKPDNYVSPKWDAFYENYILLAEKQKGLCRKGGLFTEFVDRNKRYMDVKKITNQQNKICKETEQKIYYTNHLSGGSSLQKYNNNININDKNQSNYTTQVGNKFSEEKSILTNFLNPSLSQNFSNHKYSLSQSQTLKKPSNFLKETTCPNLEKAKKVIEDKRLYKLKHYLVKTGAMKI